VLPLDKHHSIRTISPHAGLFAISYATHDRSHVHWFSSRTPPVPPSPDEEDPSPEIIRAELLETYGSFPQPIPKLIECTDKIYYWPVYRLHPMPRDWFSPLGRIVLVGDAAHAMLPHAAQGVGMGVEDAVVVGKIIAALANQTASPSIIKPSAALWQREYQKRRAARVEYFIAHAEGQGKVRKDNGWIWGKLREWGLWLAFPIINWASTLNTLVPDLQGWGYDPEMEIISLDGL
jgi:2-polyprenyl-6-methoxyphenol hydroxylase-like FAD-dependent oxidoreductase